MLDINNIFMYHIPKDNQPQRYEEIREMFLYLAGKLQEICPESRELTIAIRKLEEAMFYANASIARNE